MSSHAITRSVLPDGRPVHFVTDQADQIIGDEIRRTGMWQPLETALIRALVSPDDHAVDAGAHIGYFTVVLSKLVGPTGRVSAFEPEPRNFELLKTNCILNGCGNVTVEPIALGEARGVATLYLASGNLGDHRLHYTPDRPTETVEVNRLDDRLSAGRIDFLKLDTQGSEAAILRGASESIAANADRLICLMEISPCLSRTSGYDLSALLTILQELGAHAYSTTLPPRLMNARALLELWDRLVARGVEDANEMILLGFSKPACDRIHTRLAKRARTLAAETAIRRRVFEDVYRHCVWDSVERSSFFSGPGSIGAPADVFIRNMSDILRRHVQELKREVTLVDLGCGDYRIGSALVARVPQLIYVGCDIVPELVDYNNAEFANERVSFRLLDIVSDELPDGDICLIKQVFQHCSNSDVQRVIRKLRYQHIYITEGQPEERIGAPNPDRATGADLRFDWRTGRGRGVELEMPPFNLPLQEMFRASAPPHEVVVTSRVERRLDGADCVAGPFSKGFG